VTLCTLSGRVYEKTSLTGSSVHEAETPPPPNAALPRSSIPCGPGESTKPRAGLDWCVQLECRPARLNREATATGGVQAASAQLSAFAARNFNALGGGRRFRDLQSSDW
jgi:hypothetical protein